MRTYVGIRTADEARVEVVENGERRSLFHVVVHSPSGFEWGYGGSGPADLALAILTSHFREDPVLVKTWRAKGAFGFKCSVCMGDGYLVGGVAPGLVGEDGGRERAESDTMACAACDGSGLAQVVEPRASRLYQVFKSDVVARLQTESWELTEAEIAAWVTLHGEER